MSIIRNKKSRFGNILYNHIKNNKREYLIVTILFFVGLIIGVLFINNTGDVQTQEINNYLNTLINNIKDSTNINMFRLLKQSMISNIIIAGMLWFGASTIIGIPVVYGTLILRGFSIGYTISSIISSFGILNGLIISLLLLLLHNIVFVPAMLATSVSGLKLYKSIMKNKDRENVRVEIIRHTIFCSLMLILMIISSFIEVYISTNISIFLLKYIKF